MNRIWVRRAITAVIILGLALSYAAWWADSRQANLTYLFRPLTVELDGVVASPDGAVTIRLRQMTLTATELVLAGHVETAGFEGFVGTNNRISLVNLTRTRVHEHGVPLAHRLGSSPPKWGLRYDLSGKALAEWRFPYTQLNAGPGDQLAFVLQGYSLDKHIDRGDTVKVADLAPDRLPVDLRVGQESIYRILAVDWSTERGETRITGEHLPGPALEGLDRGYMVSLSIPLIRDQRNEVYHSMGGSGTGSPGGPWVTESAFLPIDPAEATELTFTFQSIGLSWESYSDPVPHALIDLPRDRR